MDFYNLKSRILRCKTPSFGMWKTAFYVVSVYNCYGGRLPASVGKYYGYSAGGLSAHYKGLGDVGRL